MLLRRGGKGKEEFKAASLAKLFWWWKVHRIFGYSAFPWVQEKTFWERTNLFCHGKENVRLLRFYISLYKYSITSTESIQLKSFVLFCFLIGNKPLYLLKAFQVSQKYDKIKMYCNTAQESKYEERWWWLVLGEYELNGQFKKSYTLVMSSRFDHKTKTLHTDTLKQWLQCWNFLDFVLVICSRIRSPFCFIN